MVIIFSPCVYLRNTTGDKKEKNTIFKWYLLFTIQVGYFMVTMPDYNYQIYKLQFKLIKYENWGIMQILFFIVILQFNKSEKYNTKSKKKNWDWLF